MATRVVTSEDTFDSLANEAGLSPQELYDSNATVLNNAAQARGFGDAVFYHNYRDDKGELQNEVRYRIFTGEVLEVPDKKTASKKDSATS